MIPNETQEISKCDHCGQPVPRVFLKNLGLIGVICHPCYSVTAQKGKWDYPFFGFEAQSELARLRKAVPKFPGAAPKVSCDSPEWPSLFTEFCTRKASWYGFSDAFELFGECLK